MDDLRKEKRAPILLKVKYKSASVDEFIQQSGLDISRGGIFIKTKTPMDIGTVLKFEFQLSDGAPVIHGVGRVAWRRGADVATRDLPPGMGVKFIKLDPESRTIVDRTVSQRGMSPSRYDAGDEETSGEKPTPTAEPVTTPRAPISAAGPSSSATLRGAALPPAAAAHVANTTPAPRSAASRAAASALRPQATMPLPTMSKTPTGSGARPAPPGVFSAPAKSAVVPPSTTLQSTAARARDSASGRATLPSTDPFSDAEAPTSFFPKGPPAPAPANEDSTQVRHVSEFLASVMSEAGATDQSIAAEAQASAEKARKREHEVEEQRLGALEAQLFGDMAEPTVSVPLKAVSLSPKAAVEKDPLASEPPRGSPELHSPIISRMPAAPVPAQVMPSMQASLAPSSKEAETGRQSGFGAAQASAVEAKFPVPEAARPVLSLSGGDVPSVRPQKSGSAAWVAIVAIGALLGGGAYWYFQLGGAQMVAGGAKPTATVEPTPELAAAPQTAAVAGPTAEPAPVADPSAPAPTEAVADPSADPNAAPTEPTPAATPAAMADLQITSVPKDATFAIDGVAQGKTPKRVQLAVGSTVNITVSAFGFKPMTQQYTVVAKNEPLRFKLETMSFVLTVRTVPIDAHVLVRNLSGDNAQPMDLGYVNAPVTVTVSKSGFTKKQKRVTPDMFIEQNGVMVAGIEVGLRRPGAAVDGDVEEPASDPGAAIEAPIAADPTPPPAPAPIARPEPEPEPEPEPAPPPRPAPRPDPEPALPDNPF